MNLLLQNEVAHFWGYPVRMLRIKGSNFNSNYNLKDKKKY